MCPKCNLPLAPDGTGIRRCRECGGVWLDAASIRRAEESERFRGRLTELRSLLQGFTAGTDYACPDCPDQRLVRGRIRGVEVEWCRSCRGIHLDMGELPKVTHPEGARDAASSASGAVWAVGDGLTVVGDLLAAIFDW